MYISAEMHGACTMCLYSCMFICDLSPYCVMSLSLSNVPFFGLCWKS